jgi:hypothetical protein
MRVIVAKLADASAKLPWPGQPNRYFAAEGEPIDADDPFWINCLNDGSLVEAAPTPSAPPAKATAKKAAPAA